MSVTQSVPDHDIRSALGSGAAALLFVVLQAATVAHLTMPAGSAGLRADMVSLVLAVNAVALALTAWRSSLPFGVYTVDPLATAVTVAAVGAVAAAETDMVTSGVITAITVLACGLVLLALAGPRRIRVLDPIPLPMMGAMMGTIAVVGIASGLSVAVDQRVDLAAITNAENWPRLGFVALAGLVTWFLGRNGGREGREGPVLIAACGFIAVGAEILPAAQAATDLGGLPHPVVTRWAAVQIDLLPGMVPVMIAVSFLGALRLLAAIRRMEEAASIDASPVREFRLAGVLTVLSALTCGAPPALSHEAGMIVRGGCDRPRRVLAGMAVACAALAIVAGPAIAAISPMALGVLLVVSGLDMLERWVIETSQRAALIETAGLIGVLVLTLEFGPVQGILAGTGLGAVGFALAYSRSRPVRSRYAGDLATSNVDYPTAERLILNAQARSRIVMHLQGFLFFGTADRLLGEVRDEIARGEGALRFLILDFSGVDGVDSSAVASFARLIEEVGAHGIVLCLAEIAPEVVDRLLDRHEFEAPPLIFASLDLALEHAETRTLTASRGEGHVEVDLPSVLVSELGEAIAGRLRQALEVVDIPAGEAVVRQGDASNDLFFLGSGRASVYVKGANGREIRVRSFGPGTMIGEMGFHLETARTATVVADSVCQVHRLSRQTLERLEEHDPETALAFHGLITRRLCLRILDKDHLVNSLLMVSRQL